MQIHPHDPALCYLLTKERCTYFGKKLLCPPPTTGVTQLSPLRWVGSPYTQDHVDNHSCPMTSLIKQIYFMGILRSMLDSSLI